LERVFAGCADGSADFTNGDPLPLSGIYSDAQIIELDGPHGSDQLVTTSTSAYLGSDEIRYPSGTQLKDNLTSSGGIIAIAGTTNLSDPAEDSVTVAPGATVLLNGSQTISNLTIDSGGTVRQISPIITFGATVITVGSLTIQGPDPYGDGGGVLDLGYGDLIYQPGIAADGIAPDTTSIISTSEYTVIQQLLAAGYDEGNWDGVSSSGGSNPAAIISSGAANDPYQIESLGYAQVGSDTRVGDLNISTFDGQSVSTGDVVVALTYYGDAYLDRQVNSTDYSMIGATYPSSSVQIGGDFNYDGAVNAADDDLFNTTVALLGATSGVSLRAHAPGDINSNDVAADRNGTTTVIVGGSDISGSNVSLSGTVTISISKNTPLPAGASITIQSQSVDTDGTITVTLSCAGFTKPGSYVVLFSMTSPDGTTVYTASHVKLEEK
jgi:hypothetical protein